MSITRTRADAAIRPRIGRRRNSPSPRRLAVVAPSPGWGGAESYLLTILDAARAAGWSVVVGTQRTDPPSPMWQRLGQSGFDVRALQTGRPQTGGRIGAARALARDAALTARFLRQAKADVGFFNLATPELTPGGMLAAGLVGPRSLAVFHLVPPTITVSPMRRRIYALARRRQGWVAVSDDNRRLLLEAFAARPAAVVRVYNGIPDMEPPDADERQATRLAIRAELGLESDALLILTTARLTAQKACDVVLEAVPKILQRTPNAVLAWAGSGELEAELHARRVTLGAERRFLLLGHRTDVRRLLSAADLFLFPSRYEGFGFALVEAMSLGVPVIASRRSALPEIVHDGVHGRLFELGDADDLALAIHQAVAEPVRTHAMAEAARTRVRQMFRQEEMVATTLRLIDSLARLP